MKHLALSVLFALSLSSVASAQTVKPSVCSDFRVFERDGSKVGVCFDTKRPAVWSTWQLIKVGSATVAVGFKA